LFTLSLEGLPLSRHIPRQPTFLLEAARRQAIIRSEVRRLRPEWLYGAKDPLFRSAVPFSTFTCEFAAL
jgi:hypothetical protein